MLTMAVVSLMVLGLSGNAWAQLKGHYLPGFTGLDNGTQPPPSIWVGAPLYIYPTDTIKDGNGQSIGGQPEITVAFTGVSVAAVTNVKVFGASYGFQAIPIDFMRARLETNSLDVPGSWGFSDIWIAPVWLGWHHPRSDVVASYSFFAPTGEWEFLGRDNSGLGMWSHDFQVGATVHLDSVKKWTTSVLGTYEIHTHKRDTDIQVGDIFTIEGGTGRAFYEKVSGTALPRIINLGVVYYAQFKVTSDEGPEPILAALDKDRVFAIGAEANMFLPKAKLQLTTRLLPEFGARTRTQGLTFLFSIGYQARSLVRQP